MKKLVVVSLFVAFSGLASAQVFAGMVTYSEN